MKKETFKDIRIVDNFYQSSSFFPMPTILVGTLAENGQTNLGAYSLCFPYYVAGKDYYAMILIIRNSSNTAKNLLRTGKCSLNFISDDDRYFKEAVRLGYPGDTTEEKMKDCIFTLDELVTGLEISEVRPQIIAEAVQVFECTWQRDLDNAENDKVQEEYLEGYHNFNGITSEFGAHFILKIDKILIKEKQYDAILNGITSSAVPKYPIDYGYRDNKNFWYVKTKKAKYKAIPKSKGVGLDTVKYAAERIDDKIKFKDEACQKLILVPRVFLNTALRGCVQWAKENNVELITAEHMDVIRDKRSKEKSSK